MGAIGQPLVQDWFGFVQSDTVAFLIAFFFLTYLSVSLGELVPKAIALQRASGLRSRWRGRSTCSDASRIRSSGSSRPPRTPSWLFGIQPAPAGVVVQTRTTT